MDINKNNGCQDGFKDGVFYSSINDGFWRDWFNCIVMLNVDYVF